MAPVPPPPRGTNTDPEQHRPCRACNHPRPPNGSRASVITSLGSMADAGRAGCVTCSVLSCGLARVLAHQDGADLPAAAAAPLKEGDDLLRIDFNAVASGPSLGMFVFSRGLPISVFAPPGSSNSSWLASTFPDVSVGFDVPAGTATDASLAWARKCLSRCLESHATCRRSRLPAPGGRAQRMLDIGTRDGDPVRLVEQSDDGDDDDEGAHYPEYVCLSHRWGSSRAAVLQTVSSNLSQHSKGIPWSALPQTYRETILFVRRLGVRRLWIDSLCIVQDDAHDWRQESSKMGTIFNHALVVVAASRSADVEDGLFAVCGPPFEAHHLKLPLAEDATEAICFRRSLAHIPGYMDQRLGARPDLPTLTRGWIFQERFLSPRVLHFGPQELFWECLEASYCQCTCGDASHGTPASHNEAGVDHISRPKTFFSRDHWLTLSDTELDRCWHRLVEEYSTLDLTFDRDIFPAISGLAKHFQSVVQSEYLAGLWKKTLVGDLLWHVEGFVVGAGSDDGAPAQRPAPWRAPSWSWGAVKGAVKFADAAAGIVPLCEVLEASCASAGVDKTGELLDGHLKLRGRLAATRVRYEEDGDNSTAVRPWQLLRLDIVESAVNTTWADYDVRAGHDAIPHGSEVFCLALGESPVSGAIYLMILTAASLAVTCESLTLKRIGLVQLSKPPSQAGVSADLWLQRLGFPEEVMTIKLV
ncbi:hypothetical protein JDV02_004593 [Purpureocillium takamizusanense]|uniref:Heterokaryon incompatibility domain-containing protein n=1 Tax=Purpureocillium takamizusanense TaxID=2060973 RepID=A0A9Q8VAX9_9HYPO|nr:uncharacterized protein JDV02_004593 [Purpureocillium takamizusanense]UNI18319.1 hypothetical protein JDV02_004593 [Purpureocillium takamizusanense]